MCNGNVQLKQPGSTWGIKSLLLILYSCLILTSHCTLWNLMPFWQRYIVSFVCRSKPAEMLLCCPGNMHLITVGIIATKEWRLPDIRQQRCFLKIVFGILYMKTCLSGFVVTVLCVRVLDTCVFQCGRGKSVCIKAGSLPPVKKESVRAAVVHWDHIQFCCWTLQSSRCSVVLFPLLKLSDGVLPGVHPTERGPGRGAIQLEPLALQPAGSHQAGGPGLLSLHTPQGEARPSTGPVRTSSLQSGQL